MLNQQARTHSTTVKKTGLSFLLILSALMAVTSLSTDIYLPAMPVMAKDLQGDAELTITGFLILFTHSQGGGPGWYTAMKNNKVKAIVAFEPGSSFVFPEKELPAPMPSAFDTLKGEPVPMEQFMALTKIPILIIYGDNIPDKPVAMPAQDSWRVRLAMAREWRDVVNKHGGDVTVTHLPEVGIKGNTHFPFSDLNNVQIADLVSQFLKDKNLQ